jgi:hypothetical protein
MDVYMFKDSQKLEDMRVQRYLGTRKCVVLVLAKHNEVFKNNQVGMKEQVSRSIVFAGERRRINHLRWLKIWDTTPWTRLVP